MLVLHHPALLGSDELVDRLGATLAGLAELFAAKKITFSEPPQIGPDEDRL
jgi:hypothetical protein